MRARPRPLLAGAALLAAACLAAGSAAASTLFGLVDTGELFASTDQGATWSVRAALPLRDAVSLAAGASASQLTIASRSGTVLRSTDAGTSWTATGAVPASDVVEIVVRSDLGIVLLTASGTVFVSTDAGTSFAAWAELAAPDFVSLAREQPGSDLVAATRTGEVWSSTDGGVTWSAVGAVPVPDAREIRYAGVAIHLLTGTGDLYRSLDGGAAWIAIGTLSQVGAASLVVDQGTLLAAIGTGEIASSADGTTWTWRGSIDQMTVAGLGIDTPAVSSVPQPGVAPGLRVSAPWPNPARGGASISLDLRLDRAADVAIDLCEPSGRIVGRAHGSVAAAGETRVALLTQGLPAGVYLLRVDAAGGAPVGRRVIVLP